LNASAFCLDSAPLPHLAKCGALRACGYYDISIEFHHVLWVLNIERSSSQIEVQVLTGVLFQFVSRSYVRKTHYCLQILNLNQTWTAFRSISWLSDPTQTWRRPISPSLSSLSQWCDPIVCSSCRISDKCPINHRSCRHLCKEHYLVWALLHTTHPVFYQAHLDLRYMSVESSYTARVSYNRWDSSFIKPYPQPFTGGGSQPLQTTWASLRLIKDGTKLQTSLDTSPHTWTRRRLRNKPTYARGKGCIHDVTAFKSSYFSYFCYLVHSL